jgi:hypothetical protein
VDATAPVAEQGELSGDRNARINVVDCLAFVSDHLTVGAAM